MNGEPARRLAPIDQAGHVAPCLAEGLSRRADALKNFGAVMPKRVLRGNAQQLAASCVPKNDPLARIDREYAVDRTVEQVRKIRQWLHPHWLALSELKRLGPSPA